MKDLLFAALILSGSLLSGSAIGQKRADTLQYPNEKVIVETDSSIKFSQGGRYNFNRFWDNWFVTAGAGGQIFFGNEDGLKPVGKRITATYELSVGKWVHPALGFRVKIGGGPVKGYSSGKLTSIGHSLIVGGADADGIFTQKWNQFYGELDFLVDLNNAIGGYKRERLYSAVFYAGVGIAKASDQPKNDGDRTAMATLGLLNRFRVAKNFDLNLEIKNAFVDHTYDREESNKNFETFLGVTAGITYRFGQAGDRLFKKPISSVTAIQSSYNHLPAIPAREPARERDTLIQPEIIREKETVVEKKVTLTQPIAVFFELGSSTITGTAKVNLSFAADVIKSSGGARFRLIGSADRATATPKYNQALSTRRSNSVRDYLVKILMVDPGQLIIEPRGGIDQYSPTKVNRTVIIRQD
ncbi:OmpA family protein [Flavitalea flava]